MLARCKILFLLLALTLSSPLGWIMEGPSHSGSKCNGMCCPKGSHSQAVRLAQQERQQDDASCRRGPVKHWSMCLTRSNQAADYVVVAPLAGYALSREFRDGTRRIARCFLVRVRASACRFCTLTLSTPAKPVVSIEQITR